MDPINPWLDPAEVRHLAEQLLRPVAPARLEAADPGFDSSFVGFLPANHPQDIQPKSLQRSAPAPVAEPPIHVENVLPAEEPSLEPKAETTATPEPASEPATEPGNPEPVALEIAPPPPPLLQAPSRSRFLGRIHIFRDWMAKNFSAREIFILDREGKVIFDESGHGRLHFMARNLALASRSGTPQNGNIHVKIGPASILEVIPCETPYGQIVLGALVPESLPLQHVQTISEVLIQTASPA